MPKKKLPQTTITEGKHHPQLQYAPVSFSHAVYNALWPSATAIPLNEPIKKETA